jgi:hypothetical protein
MNIWDRVLVVINVYLYILLLFGFHTGNTALVPRSVRVSGPVTWHVYAAGLGPSSVGLDCDFGSPFASLLKRITLNISE